MASQTYNVPVILPDLRKEESYSQIVDALEYLEVVANDIFYRISSRVAENRDQLTQINNRINTAQAKIEKLRSTTTKATRVFSSPKYPAPKRITDYRSLYQDVNPGLSKAHRRRIQVESRVPDVTQETIKGKQRPIIMNLGRKGIQSRVTFDDPEEGEGLGRLPRHLPSVSSLLLFNTEENPYKKYVVLDPLEGAKIKTRDSVEEENKLSEAPVSITKGEELIRGQQDSMMYVPVMPELPELDVPEMLPQLQYIASDMFYTGEVGASIAPSLANTAVPDLPNLADPEAPATSEPPPPPADSGSGSNVPPAPAPPPPPPPAPVEDAPFLPPIQEDSDEEDDEEGGGGPPVESGGGDDRSNLMAAIREAGGASKAGLKSVKDRKRQRKAKKEESVPSSGGDLLGDLTAALGRRRKAMSGKDKENKREEKKEEHSLGGGSMMDNISRMIPAPPPPAGGGSDADSGEESAGADW